MATLVINNIADRLKRLQEGIGPDRLLPVVARGATTFVQDHLRALDRSRANELGGRRSHFYAHAARGTTHQVEGNTITITVHQLGIRQRYYGGVIRPVNAKRLAIPADKSAYGRSPREFNDLKLGAFRKGGRLIFALVVATTYAVRSKRGADGTTRTTRGPRSKRSGLVMFWLRDQVTQIGDPSVLPAREDIATAAVRAGDDYVLSLVQRGGRL